MSMREDRIEEAMQIMPVENVPKPLSGDSLPEMKADVKNMELDELSSEIFCIQQMAKEAYDQSKAIAEAADDMLDERSQSASYGTASTNLSTAISAIAKVANLKLKIIEIKKKEATGDDDGTVKMNRDELLQMLQSNG